MDPYTHVLLSGFGSNLCDAANMAGHRLRAFDVDDVTCQKCIDRLRDPIVLLRIEPAPINIRQVFQIDPDVEAKLNAAVRAAALAGAAEIGDRARGTGPQPPPEESPSDAAVRATHAPASIQVGSWLAHTADNYDGDAERFRQRQRQLIEVVVRKCAERAALALPAPHAGAAVDAIMALMSSEQTEPA